MKKFDEFGNLFPYQLIELSVDEVKENFTWNEKRKVLFEELFSFFEEVKILEITDSYVWINGSFVTNKTDPNDIDIVLFIPFLEQEKHINVLKFLKNKYLNLDLYFVKIYPSNHKSHFLYEMDKLEWSFQFTQTRKNLRTGKSRSKGFIQINL